MRHSKGKKTHKGQNNRTNASTASHTGPVTLEDLQRKQAPVNKDNLTTRMVSIRLIPADENSATIKRNVEVLDNPDNILQLLRHRKAMEEAFLGNNITTGPTQFSFVRQFLTGESLRVFNEGATTAGTETTGNLVLALNHLVTFNCPREVLSKQTDYLKTMLAKPREMTTRQYVGYYNNLNAICGQLPPGFNATQKLTERELIINIAHKAPKNHKKMLIQQGYNPENGSMADLIDYCERAETTDHVLHGAIRDSNTMDYSSSSDSGFKEKRSRRSKPNKKKEWKDARPRRDKPEFYCKYHKANTTHDTADCKVLNNGDKPAKVNNSSKWKDPKHREKKYSRELHAMEIKVKRQKSKIARLRQVDSSSSEEEVAMKPRARRNVKIPESDDSDSSEDEQSDYVTPRQGSGQDHNPFESSDSEDSE